MRPIIIGSIFIVVFILSFVTTQSSYYFYQRYPDGLWRSAYGDFSSRSLIRPGITLSKLRAERQFKRLFFVDNNLVRNINFNGTDERIFFIPCPTCTIVDLSAPYGRVVILTRDQKALSEIYVCKLNDTLLPNCVKVSSAYNGAFAVTASTYFLYYALFESSSVRVKAVSFFDIEDKEFNAVTTFVNPGAQMFTNIVAAGDSIFFYDGLSVKQFYNKQISMVQETVTSLYFISTDTNGRDLFWCATGINVYLVKKCSTSPASGCSIILRDNQPISEFASFF